jgi:hypothetical protein
LSFRRGSGEMGGLWREEGGLGMGREKWVPCRFEEWGVAVVRERRRRVERVEVVGTCMVRVCGWLLNCDEVE